MVLRLIAILLFISPNVFAQTTGGGTTNNNTDITSLSTNGYSRLGGRAAGEPNASATFIYGGVAGASNGACSNDDDIPCCIDRTANSVCNNCNGDESDCNSRRIHNDLLLTIQFRPPAASGTITGGSAFLTNNINESDAGFAEVPIISQDPSGLIIPNGTTLVSVTVRWSDICANFFGNADCKLADKKSQVIRLGIDENNDTQANEAGISEAQIVLADLNVGKKDFCKSGGTIADVCNFRAFPGDKKVFIEQVRADCSFPSSIGTDGTANAIRVFYEEFEGATGTRPNNGSRSKDLTIGTSSGSCTTSREIDLSENEVDGLENGQSYMFTIGILDEANNLGGILDPAGVVTIPTDETEDDSCFQPDADAPGNCHVATPDQVIGLFDKELDCFIATAAFGSPFESKVKDFRNFRNQFLHPTWVGQKVIKFYYRNSPPIARWIDQHPQFKPLAQVILYPLWLFAVACLNHPLLVMLSLVAALSMILLRRKNNGVHL